MSICMYQTQIQIQKRRYQTIGGSVELVKNMLKGRMEVLELGVEVVKNMLKGQRELIDGVEVVY